MQRPGYGLYTYRIDAQDRVVHLSENWLAFARENGAEERCHPDKVLGRRIWDFVAGDETRHLYELVFERVRSGSHAVTVEFRCDAPGEERFCQLAIISKGQGVMELYSKISRTRARPPVRLLDPGAPRSSALIRICSVCKRVSLPEDQWAEVEVAIRRLKLFEQPQLPQITHVVCPDCHRAVADELQKL